MKLNDLKSLFLKIMLGCLIAAAALAVGTILIGHFNDLAEKALWTIALVALHSLISFGFIVNNEKQDTFDNLAFFTNVTFGIIVLSFMTSVLGVWSVISPDLVRKLYELYFVLLFATLHAEILYKMRGHQPSIDRVILSNFAFMTLVVLMLVPVIFVDNSAEVLGAFYFRVLAAAGIVDATLTLTAVILHKLYLRAHPTLNDGIFTVAPAGTASPTASQAAPARRGVMSLFVKLLIAYVALQLIAGLFFLVFLFSSGI